MVIRNEEFEGVALQAEVGPETQLKGCVFRDCAFVSARMKDAVVDGCRFIGCSFERANLQGFIDRGNVWEDCDFTKTRLDYAQLGRRVSEFSGCRFVETSFRSVDRFVFNHVPDRRAPFSV